MELIFESVEICRTCKQPSLVEVLNLGSQPLANSLVVSPGSKELRVPLVLLRCESCNLLQLSVNVNPSIMFSNYNWVTGTSALSVDHCRIFASRAIDYIGEKNFSVLEIGSNDGIMLGNFKDWGIRHLGCEPSANVAQVAKEKEINTIVEFFNEELAENIIQENGQADAFIAANVMCHIPYFHSIVAGISKLIKKTGIVIFEDPYLGDVIEKTSYVQI
jgi:methylation protein EvaC